MIGRLVDTMSSKTALQRESNLTPSQWDEKTKIKTTDFGWIIMNIGMAIGAGIVFLPIQVGLDGMWVFVAAAIIGYPLLYGFQRLYLNVLAKAEECENFAGIVSGYLGSNIGLLLGFCYFLLSMIAIFLYSTALTNDSASFLVTFNVTKDNVSQNAFYGLAVICVLVLIASQGERLLMKVSSGMVCTKLFVIAVMGVIMIPYWDIAHIDAVPSVTFLVQQCVAMLPLVTLSIAFFPTLNPVITFYRNETGNKAVAHYRALRILNCAYFTLLIVVLFYVISFNLAISHDQAVYAYEKNISSLALAASSIDGDLVKVFSLILNIFAVMTAYFSIFLAFRDSCMGIAMNLLKRIIAVERINQRLIRYGTSVFCVIVSWGVIACNAPILSLASLLGPLMGCIGCILPVWIVMKAPLFLDYRNWKLIPIAVMGCLLVVAPLLEIFR